MSARVVLRKRIRVADSLRNADGSISDKLVLRAVIERNRAADAGKDKDDELSLAIRRSANLSPHFLDGERDVPPTGKYSKSEYPKPAPEVQEAIPPSENTELTDDETQVQNIVPNVEFLTTWGLALRQNPQEPGLKDKVTGKLTFNWRDGRDPDTTRRVLLEPSDVLTEITDGEGLGDLPTQEMFDDRERRSVAVDTALEPAQYSNAAQHWGTRKWTSPTFGTAREAMRLVGVDWVNSGFTAPADRDGENINIVIVDTGLNESYLRSLIPDLAFGGGFVDRSIRRSDPGEFLSPYTAVHSGHGNMIARNILRIAPRARIFDAPLLPPRVTDVGYFTHSVEMLFESIQELRATSPYADQPWMIVNAWAIADNIQERDLGPLNMLYATGEFHNTNTLIQNMSEEFAIVFAAGNNGLFEPSPGAGIYNRGPHRPNGNPSIENGRPFGSIAGANSLPGVLTAGACTVNGAWIGSSSQGDAPEALRRIDNAVPSGKPDLVAPSWFAEPNDSHQKNTGTSASCAVVAGLAASGWSANPNILPQELLEAMRNAAVSLENETAINYLARFGNGIAQYPF